MKNKYRRWFIIGMFWTFIACENSKTSTYSKNEFNKNIVEELDSKNKALPVYGYGYNYCQIQVLSKDKDLTTEAVKLEVMKIIGMDFKVSIKQALKDVYYLSLGHNHENVKNDKQSFFISPKSGDFVGLGANYWFPEKTVKSTSTISIDQLAQKLSENLSTEVYVLVDLSDIDDFYNVYFAHFSNGISKKEIGEFTFAEKIDTGDSLAHENDVRASWGVSSSGMTKTLMDVGVVSMDSLVPNNPNDNYYLFEKK